MVYMWYHIIPDASHVRMYGISAGSSELICSTVRTPEVFVRLPVIIVRLPGCKASGNHCNASRVPLGVVRLPPLNDAIPSLHDRN